MSSIEKAVERLRGISGNRSRADVTPKQVEPPSTSDSQVANFAGHDSSVGQSTCHIDLERLERHGFITPLTQRRASVKELQLLKRPLIKNAFGLGAGGAVENSNLVMVTSALAGEGKTFVAMNLAMSIALERDTTVLLIDSDVVRPALSRLLGLDAEPGMTDLILDRNLSVGDVIKSTNIDKLRVIPAGRRYVHSAELLASEEMHRLAVELSGRYPNRVVLFDAPPQLATAEASVLAHWMGQILVVVEESSVAGL